MNLLTRKEAAARLRIGLRTLDRRLAEGAIKCHRFGDGPRAQIRISEKQIESYMETTVSSGHGISVEDKMKVEAIIMPRRRSV